MKQMIVFFSSLILGVLIYNLIAGDDADSAMSMLARVWEHNLELRSITP